jgi:hypothetical protein
MMRGPTAPPTQTVQTEPPSNFRSGQSRSSTDATAEVSKNKRQFHQFLSRSSFVSLQTSFNHRRFSPTVLLSTCLRPSIVLRSNLYSLDSSTSQDRLVHRLPSHISRPHPPHLLTKFNLDHVLKDKSDQDEQRLDIASRHFKQFSVACLDQFNCRLSASRLHVRIDLIDFAELTFKRLPLFSRMSQTVRVRSWLQRIRDETVQRSTRFGF